MNYFKLYQELSFLLSLVFCAGLVLLAVVIFYSVRQYEKPRDGSDRVDEHLEPGIPLVLKLLYLAVAAYVFAAVIWVAVSGTTIG